MGILEITGSFSLVLFFDYHFALYAQSLAERYLASPWIHATHIGRRPHIILWMGAVRELPVSVLREIRREILERPIVMRPDFEFIYLSSNEVNDAVILKFLDDGYFCRMGELVQKILEKYATTCLTTLVSEASFVMGEGLRNVNARINSYYNNVTASRMYPVIWKPGYHVFLPMQMP